MKWTVVSTIVTLTAVAAHGQTVTVFETGFEPGDGYSTGTIIGQDGWTILLGMNPDFARISNINPLSGSQSLLLDGQEVGVSDDLGNRGAIGRSSPIAPELDGAPLLSIEITGRCAIVDPTLDPDHTSWGALNVNGADGRLVTSVGPLSEFGQLSFGWFFPDTLPVESGVAFEFRHVVDYRTGLASEWMNGQVVYEDFAPAFNPEVIPTQMYFEMASLELLPFDTQVWFDDIHMTATYGSGVCAADVNADGELDLFDFLAFVNPFNAGDLGADWNTDGVFDLFDFLGYVNAFNAGC